MDSGRREFEDLGSRDQHFMEYGTEKEKGNLLDQTITHGISIRSQYEVGEWNIGVWSWRVSVEGGGG